MTTSSVYLLSAPSNRTSGTARQERVDRAQNLTFRVQLHHLTFHFRSATTSASASLLPLCFHSASTSTCTAHRALLLLPPRQSCRCLCSSPQWQDCPVSASAATPLPTGLDDDCRCSHGRHCSLLASSTTLCPPLSVSSAYIHLSHHRRPPSASPTGTSILHASALHCLPFFNKQHQLTHPQI